MDRKPLAPNTVFVAIGILKSRERKDKEKLRNFLSIQISCDAAQYRMPMIKLLIS